MRGAPLGDDDVAGLLDDGDAVRVEQLPVSLPALPKLKLEAALAVEDLRERGGQKELISLASAQHNMSHIMRGVLSCRWTPP